MTSALPEKHYRRARLIRVGNLVCDHEGAFNLQWAHPRALRLLRRITRSSLLRAPLESDALLDASATGAKERKGAQTEDGKPASIAASA